MNEKHQEFPDRFGFRSGPRGTHSSRTIMLAELQTLLDSQPATAARDDYRSAIIDDNALGKKTATARRLTAKRLGELYVFDPRVPVFRLLRHFWDLDREGRPLLAFLCASARDPLLRLTAPPVLQAKEREIVAKESLEEAIRESAPDRFKPATYLSAPVKDLLKELTSAGKKFGIHAALGALGTGARSSSVRLGLLSIIFRSAGLPDEYFKARFVMWLKSKKLMEKVEEHLQTEGTSLREELQDMYVSTPLAHALLAADPSFATNAGEAHKLLAAEYPNVTDLSIDDMIAAIRKALAVGKRFPCTLLALDEIQQQIGEGADAAGRGQAFQPDSAGVGQAFQPAVGQAFQPDSAGVGQAFQPGVGQAFQPDSAGVGQAFQPDAAATVRLESLTYLRFRDDGTPAAGTFPGWPNKASALKVLDPCCGSGHFLVAAFDLLARIRMHDEGLSARDACDAVLRDNLFGLELDARCTQIAAFNLALAAWKFPDAGGYRTLPRMHIACSGHALVGKKEDWQKLAGKNSRLRWGMEQLHDLFKQANDLGSLIDPRAIKAAPSIAGSFEELEPLLQQALQREEVRQDVDLREASVMAQGIARASELLAGKYHLVITNVPFLARNKQAGTLRDFLNENYPHSCTDLATAVAERALRFCDEAGSEALVIPQNWLFLVSYRKLRRALLEHCTWNMVIKLGPAAFRGMNWWAANTQLIILSNHTARPDHLITGVDVSGPRVPACKAEQLRSESLQSSLQSVQIQNPDSRIALAPSENLPLLEAFASCLVGVQTADYVRFGRFFWELPLVGAGWQFQQSTVESTRAHGGREHVLFWENGQGELAKRHAEGLAYVRGRGAWGKPGIAVSQMRHLPVTLYTGEPFDNNTAIILPKDASHVAAIWAFCTSPEFFTQVRRIDQKTNVTNATFVKVPFDLAHWQAIADAAGPLPEPHSNDPTQWLFKGDVATADAPHNLQVAMARLLGYRWPDQPADQLDRFADNDGIVCLPAIGNEPAAAERLRELLAAAYGADWSPGKQESLLAAVGFGGKSLSDWLRDGFFEQHCKLFHNRPFLWHIWDGKKDGFSAVVNYHRLDDEALKTLIHHHLSVWLKKQNDARDKGESGADARYAAALELRKKLGLIQAGEKPHDIFVRWKPLEKQPIGWAPDLNDGARMNIRPFVEADILRKKPNIKWAKDKGKDPESAPWYHVFQGERINDHHLSLEEKRAARK